MSCQETYFLENETCQQCTSEFEGSIDCTADEALSCDDSHFLHDGECVEICPETYFGNEFTRICQLCTERFEGSTYCAADEALSCTTGYTLFDGSCSNDPLILQVAGLFASEP